MHLDFKNKFGWFNSEMIAIVHAWLIISLCFGTPLINQIEGESCVFIMKWH